LYNKENFVLSTISSVLAQDFEDYEIIVVDDGSSDASAERLGAVADSRLRYIRQRNQGVAPARNTGVRVSERPWVAFLDADDLWAPNHLSALQAIIVARPEAGFVSTRWAMAGADERFEGESPGDGRFEVRDVDFFDWTTRDPRYFHTSSVAVRRDVFDAVGGFRNFRAGEDVELWARLALATPCAIGMITTDGRRRDERGLSVITPPRIGTGELARKKLPTPVLELLDRRLREGRIEDRRRSVERYFDHRILIGMKMALASGDRLRALRLWRLLRKPGAARALALLAVVAMPLALTRSLAGRRFG
jgi:glycosyltransferase involved in cell wall biosynthesis